MRNQKMLKIVRFPECDISDVFILYRGDQNINCINDIMLVFLGIFKFLLEFDSNPSGSKLRFVRKLMEKTQAELGLLLGVSELTVRRWENKGDGLDINAYTLMLVMEAKSRKIKVNDAEYLRSRMNVHSIGYSPIVLDGRNGNFNPICPNLFPAEAFTFIKESFSRDESFSSDFQFCVPETLFSRELTSKTDLFSRKGIQNIVGQSKKKADIDPIVNLSAAGRGK